ncbi:hypothetical protein [Aliarcobacter vitoriensis]|uniref:Leucyl, phenylalanyl-tRNA-protein transferase n=1 Tax=Aliarcobacter vitoriensis TaxID=2011099 RepID=A0A366MV77_9BACT|nr:hypothetical protein [Aliarcobacter vitoriensis]RBQ30166.1 hypothetical protein CRU91_00560 [Aliarcobacter vitoriensis]
MSQEFLYLINKDDLTSQNLFEIIYPNTTTNYYISDDFSKDFYTKLCTFGFISTSINIQDKIYLLPEIQFEYAVLDFCDIHISKKVKKLLNKNEFKFYINNDFLAVLKKIKEYHNDSWLEENYEKLLLNLKDEKSEDFELFCAELYNINNNLIAGEIGYKIKKTYTSLTGFSSKDKAYKDWGKLQMVLLNTHLQNENFEFWNLGHPYMQYKFDLGAKLYSREEFLNKWLKAIL